MKNPLVMKLITIIGLCFLFVVGLMMVSALVEERKDYHAGVMSEIKSAHVGDQSLTTPFLQVQTSHGTTSLIFANKTDINATASVSDDEYSRGIYHAISYQAKVAVGQQFRLSSLDNLPIPAPPAPADNAPVQQASASPAQLPKATGLTLIIPISDLRGAVPTVATINGKNYPVKFPTTKTISMPHLAVNLDELVDKQDELAVAFELSLAGMDSLNFMPLGENFTATLKSNWREPKFFGNALPATKTITEQGFSATWQAGSIASENQSTLACQDSSCTGEYQYLNTAFVQVSDTYAQTDRTIKYALLLMVVSFGTFFLFETIKGLRIHPIQYGLVASSLLVFYVLLLSLAEQVAFAIAYLSASVACVGLIGWYACYVLAGVKRGLFFSVILGGLYACFYVILSARELNLLMGAVFCFVLIAVVMYITRHINWYDVDKKDKGASDA